MLANISKFINIKEYQESFELDLNRDIKAKNFWEKQLKILIDKFAVQIRCVEEYKRDKEESIVNYQKDYNEKVTIMMSNQHDFLSVRELLNINEILLDKYQFEDVWKEQKKNENKKAITILGDRLKVISDIDNKRKRWEELVTGILSANIFDSGSTAVEEIRNNNKNFGFDDAYQFLRKRPWLFDDFDIFMDRLEKKAFKCVVIFCDNSGYDFVLGVIPLSVEFLKLQTKVILCANSRPSLNDITIKEMIDVVNEAGQICETIKTSLDCKNLILSPNGQSSCCLNFMDIKEDLLELMIEMETDLIIIEGVGRSIHTNFDAQFKCESLKLAVLKNNFLAEKLGGKIFDAVCKYEYNNIDIECNV